MPFHLFQAQDFERTRRFFWTNQPQDAQPKTNRTLIDHPSPSKSISTGKNHFNGSEKLVGRLVGTVRFELTASCSQSRRANQTTLRPVKKMIPKVMQTTWQRNFFIFSNLTLSEFFQFAKITYHHIMIS